MDTRASQSHLTRLFSEGFSCKRESEWAIRDLESLRNNLAHAQGMLTYHWLTIVNRTRRLDRISSRL